VNSNESTAGKRPMESGTESKVMVRRNKRRRGVVILVVLSLLVLFTLLVVTYAIVSGQYRRAAEAFARQELLGVQPQKDLDRAFYQILRDTPQRTSAVRYHSLLRDYYGEDGFAGPTDRRQFGDPGLEYESNAHCQRWSCSHDFQRTVPRPDRS
jgi:hypothetical protein